MLSETALVTVLYGPAPVPVLGEQGPKRILRYSIGSKPPTCVDAPLGEGGAFAGLLVPTLRPPGP
jgi:hypothetical protein